MFSSKRSFFKTAFIVIVTITISSCNENEKTENKYVLIKNTEQTEAYFFVATAGVTKTIISKAQLAQRKSLQNSIKMVSSKIENNQKLLLQEINKIAVQKLIVISEINTSVTNKDLYELANKKDVDFDDAYLNSITQSLTEMIESFESITKETNDMAILKLVAHYLPKQYEFLRETEKIKKTNQLKSN
jgi:predicted outer membrane protein